MPEKIQACIGFEPTWPMWYQCIFQLRYQHNKPAGSWSFFLLCNKPVKWWTMFKSHTGLNFFRPYFHFCLSSVHYCKDCFHIHFLICSSHSDFHIFTVENVHVISLFSAINQRSLMQVTQRIRKSSPSLLAFGP